MKLRALRRPVQQETHRIKEENNFSAMFATLSTKGGGRIVEDYGKLCVFSRSTIEWQTIVHRHK